MGSRAIQLALIIALGAGIGLLVSQPWRAGESGSAVPPVRSAPVAATSQQNSHAPAQTAQSSHAEVTAPPTRTFRLPAMPAPIVDAKPKEETAKRPDVPPIFVPKDWLLRGTGPHGYDVKIDRAEVISGRSSVQMVSHDKDISPTLFASLMQSIIADPWVGKRVEFSVSTKMLGFRQHADVWIRATDSGKAVIAYDHVDWFYGKPEWRRRTIIMDIPWSAAEIAYGVNLDGPGTLWVDNAQLRAVDKAVDVTNHTLPSQLGVIVQDADKKGPLAMPSNMDFEDTVAADDAFREVPQDALGRTRF